MSTNYDHKRIEKKWQKVWKQLGIYRTAERRLTPIPKPQMNADSISSISVHPRRNQRASAKCYVLDMFPYPSGDGLHVGHPKGYIATDVYSRMKRMQGHSILHPMGWDAFGLPAENYAIQNKIHPALAVKKNIKRFKKQLKLLGFNYDWEREINTTDPNYYKWTQWIFLQMFHHGLAYRSNEPINWCPSCKTGLANEDLEDGRCERCGSVVERRAIPQWVLKITDYADRLLEGLEKLDWPEHIKESQKNWIGKSEGAEIKFKVKSSKLKVEEEIKVFTTRPDTLFGTTYLVLAPEHPFVQEQITNHRSQITNKSEIQDYINQARAKPEKERTAEGKEKTGVELKEIRAVNPANGEEIPVWIADYVLAEYGTGAIMAVPAHDERDFQFAKKYNLPIQEVNRRQEAPNTPLPPSTLLTRLPARQGGGKEGGAFVGEGLLINSGKFSGMRSEEAKRAITDFVRGKLVTKYKLRDWVFSRQRYWGEPIPLIHCQDCGVVPVPEKDLPVKLPNVTNYRPTDTGESPLAAVTSWVNTKCPKCGGPAKRETNTMPQWAGSCWYYIAYCISEKHKSQAPNSKQIPDLKSQSTKRNLQKWLPVDMYVGGAEHATRHLIYARFWHKFLQDIGVVSAAEPFRRLQNVGLILASDGRKMSKRYGNVINPDDIVERFGADSLRVYEMFMGPFNQAIAWSTDSLVGSRRFLEKVWRLRGKSKITSTKSQTMSNDRNSKLQTLMHQTIGKVGEDIEQMKFNTAVSALMILVNAFEKERRIAKGDFEVLLKLLAPFAPHLSEELWMSLGRKKSIHTESWPAYDAHLAEGGEVTMVVQVNGKTRGTFQFPRGESEEYVTLQARSLPAARKWTEGKEIQKVIVVKDRLVNIVVRDPNDPN